MVPLLPCCSRVDLDLGLFILHGKTFFQICSTSASALVHRPYTVRARKCEEVGALHLAFEWCFRSLEITMDDQTAKKRPMNLS